VIAATRSPAIVAPNTGAESGSASANSRASSSPHRSNDARAFSVAIASTSAGAAASATALGMGASRASRASRVATRVTSERRLSATVAADTAIERRARACGEWGAPQRCGEDRASARE
jgi:hypothetical protein